MTQPSRKAVRKGSVQPLDVDVAELDRVGVPGEAEVPGLAVLAGVRPVAHVPGALARVGVEDGGAVQLALEGRALDRAPLEVPLAARPQVAAVTRYHAVGRAVVLARVELGVLRG